MRRPPLLILQWFRDGNDIGFGIGVGNGRTKAAADGSGSVIDRSSNAIAMGYLARDSIGMAALRRLRNRALSKVVALDPCPRRSLWIAASTRL
mmetsp:Transcript_31845/g.67453  ORF Transcript_31845/g.67453 Transcript_31845/m.67453 type:complete len:93 (-) Transcript_31845:94-372(-)